LHARYLFRQQKEEEFSVYEPYCANYTNASELMLLEEQNLMVCTFSHSHRRFFSQQDMVTMSVESGYTRLKAIAHADSSLVLEIQQSDQC